MGKPLGRKLRELFFTEQEAGGVRVLRCRCGQALSPASRGFKAVIAHVVAEHDNWLAAVVRDGRVVPDELKGEPIVQAPAAAASTENGATEEQEDESSELDVPASAVAEVVDATEVKAPAKKPGTTKRVDYLPWDDYFMSVAFLSAMRSKDPSTQVGACIVSPEKKIVGIGYNGFPNGCDDDHLPWARSTSSGSPLETKYPYVCHAEMNAILNKNSTDVKGCTIYVALFPCNECAKLIIQSGIARVVYCSDKYRDDWKFEASRRLLDMANVKYSQHKLRQTKLVIDFSSVE